MINILRKTAIFMLACVLMSATACFLASCDRSGDKKPADSTASVTSATSVNGTSSVGGTGADSRTSAESAKSESATASHNSQTSQSATTSQSEQTSQSASTSQSETGSQSGAQPPETLEPPVLTVSASQKIYVSGNFTASLSTFGCEITEITINAAIVPDERYSFDGETLTIAGEYMRTFDGKENYKLKVTTTGGNDEVYITIDDTPVITDVPKFVRMPGESLENVDLTGRVANDMGALTYTYALDASSADKGTLNDHGDGTFDFTPNCSFTGDVTFIFTATDEYGAYATETVTLTYAEPVYQTVTAESDGYFIDYFRDVAFIVDFKGNTFSDLYYGEQKLAQDEDYYIENDNKLVIRAGTLMKVYRFGQTTYTFTLDVEENDGTDFDVTFENPQNRILNGGFEAGTLYGWNAYDIWKNESGMRAWKNDRVVSGTYFDDKYEYNRDGNYNLGVYGGSISKDSGQERMGHLRSSDFVLGGTGWVSFKLGGGRNPQFAYVSIRRTSDNVEIARFGNRHFNDESLIGNNSKDGTKKNAEAYMFQYYYNLSAYSGQKLYFVISDVSSNHWCVLSADSFFTFYDVAPTTTADTLAENILPALKGVGNSSNAIADGTFGDDFDTYWTVDGSGWGVDGNSAKSNVTGGDSGGGILRSSTFNVNGDNKYLFFKFGGTRYWEKTIWVSVKEVGTNIEVKRFVLREDKRLPKGEGTADYADHYCDVHDLDTTKEYYLEFCDNETGSWGVFYVKDVRLCDETEWNSTTKRVGDISGIVTDYTYALPY